MLLWVGYAGLLVGSRCCEICAAAWGLSCGNRSGLRPATWQLLPAAAGWLPPSAKWQAATLRWLLHDVGS
jgi:hypothetical protein